MVKIHPITNIITLKTDSKGLEYRDLVQGGGKSVVKRDVQQPWTDFARF